MTKTDNFIQDNTLAVKKIDDIGYEIIALSDNEVDGILKYTKKLSRWNDLFIMFGNLKKSISDFINYYVSSLKTFECDFAEASRLVLNITGAFYILIQYSEKHFADFKSRKANEYYDKYFSYRLVYELRKYCTHSHLGIVQTNLHIEKNSSTFDMGLPKDNLINDGGLNKKFRDELKKFNSKNISINNLIYDFNNNLDSMIVDFIVSNKDNIVKTFRKVSEFIPNYKAKPRDAILAHGESRISLLKSLNNILESIDKHITKKIIINSVIDGDAYKDVLKILCDIYYGKS